jgi:tetratricopeptide (TPR) repeat protein
MAEDPTGEWGQRSAFNAGDIFFRRGELDRAADAFAIAERIDDPRSAAMATFLAGETARLLGQEEVALDAYMRAVAFTGIPSSVTAAAAKQAGMIHFGRHDGVAAAELFRLAAEVDDGEEGARGAMLLGICERQMGNRAAAVDACELALSKPGAPSNVSDRADQFLSEMG